MPPNKEQLRQLAMTDPTGFNSLLSNASEEDLSNILASLNPTPVETQDPNIPVVPSAILPEQMNKEAYEKGIAGPQREREDFAKRALIDIGSSVVMPEIKAAGYLGRMAGYGLQAAGSSGLGFLGKRVASEAGLMEDNPEQDISEAKSNMLFGTAVPAVMDTAAGVGLRAAGYPGRMFGDGDPFAKAGNDYKAAMSQDMDVVPALFNEARGTTDKAILGAKKLGDYSDTLMEMNPMQGIDVSPTNLGAQSQMADKLDAMGNAANKAREDILLKAASKENQARLPYRNNPHSAEAPGYNLGDLTLSVTNAGGEKVRVSFMGKLKEEARLASPDTIKAYEEVSNLITDNSYVQTGVRQESGFIGGPGSTRWGIKEVPILEPKKLSISDLQDLHTKVTNEIEGLRGYSAQLQVQSGNQALPGELSTKIDLLEELRASIRDAASSQIKLYEGPEAAEAYSKATDYVATAKRYGKSSNTFAIQTAQGENLVAQSSLITQVGQANSAMASSPTISGMVSGALRPAEAQRAANLARGNELVRRLQDVQAWRSGTKSMPISRRWELFKNSPEQQQKLVQMSIALGIVGPEAIDSFAQDERTARQLYEVTLSQASAIPMLSSMIEPSTSGLLGEIDGKIDKNISPMDYDYHLKQTLQKTKGNPSEEAKAIGGFLNDGTVYAPEFRPQSPEQPKQLNYGDIHSSFNSIPIEMSESSPGMFTEMVGPETRKMLDTMNRSISMREVP